MAYSVFRYEADPRGREANFLTFRSPSANLAAGSSDEVEIETGISIVDRAILRVLGMQVDGLIDSIFDALSTGADATFGLFPRLQTRGGLSFRIDDPEFVIGFDTRGRSVATDGAQLWSHEYYAPAPGGSLVATPRLVYRLQNLLTNAHGTTTVTAEDHRVRLAFEFVPVTRNVLIELLERHADIFLA